MDAIPVQQVTFPDATTEAKFKNYIKEEIRTCYEERVEREKDWAKWLTQYDGKMRRPDNPPSWASNIDIPLTREGINAINARLVNPITSQEKLMISEPRDPRYYKLAEATEAFAEFMWDQHDVDRFLSDICQNTAIYGYGVAKVPWVDSFKIIKEWVPQEVVISEGDPMLGIPPETEVQLVEQTVPVREKLGPDLISVPPADFLFPAGSTSVDSAPWVSHRVLHTESYVKNKIRDGEWADVLEQLTPIGEADTVTKTREKLMGIEPKGRRYEIHEMYVAYDIDGDGIDEEIIVTFDYNSGVILRAIYNYMHTFRRPFSMLYYERRPNSMDGVSLCYLVSDLHTAYMAATNMELDAAALAVRGWLLMTTDSHFIEQWKTMDSYLGDAVLVSALPKESSQLFMFGQTQSNMAQLVQRILFHFERIFNISGYTFGQEQTQRPTASGQNLLVEESRQPLQEKLKMLRNFMSEITEMMAMRYKQFHQNRVEYFKYVNEEAIPMIMEFPEGFLHDKVFIKTKASEENLNETIRKQELIGMYDQLTKSFQNLSGMLIQGEQMIAMGSPLGMVQGGFVQSLYHALGILLKEWKAKDQDILLPDINILMQFGQQFGFVIQQLQQQLQQMTKQFEAAMNQAQSVSEELAKRDREEASDNERGNESE